MATRRTSRRLGNENNTAAGSLTGVSGPAGKSRVAGTGLGSKPASAQTKTSSLGTKRSTRTSQLAVNKDPNVATAGAALQSKTTNKSAAAPGEAGPSKPALKTRIATRSKAAPAAPEGIPREADEAQLQDDDAQADTKPSTRPVKALRGASRNSGATSASAKPSGSLLPAKRPSSSRQVLPPEDDVFTVRENVDEQDEDEHEATVESPRKKKAKLEEEAPPKDAGWVDLDAGDEDDPLMVSEYVNEVYDYLLEVEKKSVVPANYMAIQTEITWRMRGILVDWLIEIHTSFRLLPETIFLAINIVDRFCATQVVSLVKYQLMGITALFIAAKYEEVVCPSVHNFLYMTDGGYSEEEILKAERWVLQMIGWDLSYPNPLNYLRRISKADDYDNQSRTVAKYFLEISCVDRHLVAFPPSKLAAAAAWLSRKVLERGEWGPTLVHYSAYSEEEILPCAQTMMNYIVRSLHIGYETEHPNFHKKYASRKFFKASEIVRDWVKSEYLSSSDLRQLDNWDRESVMASPLFDRPEGASSPGHERIHVKLEEWEKY